MSVDDEDKEWIFEAHMERIRQQEAERQAELDSLRHSLAEAERDRDEAKRIAAHYHEQTIALSKMYNEAEQHTAERIADWIERKLRALHNEGKLYDLPWYVRAGTWRTDGGTK